MNWLTGAVFFLRAAAAGISALVRPGWNEKALVVKVWSREPHTSAVIGEALVLKDPTNHRSWSGGENGFSVDHEECLKAEEVLLIRVWSGKALESDVITQALAIKNGCGWKDRENGYSVHRVRVKER